MFARHNNAQWDEPADFMFEPSPIWHDDPEIITDEYAKVFLRNMMTKSREGLSKIQGSVALKHQEVDKLRASMQGSQDREAISNVCLYLVNEANDSNFSIHYGRWQWRRMTR